MLDLTNVKETNNYELLPVGDYLVQCEKAELMKTKKGTGEYVKCTFTVLDDQYANRKIFHNFNIKNNNAKAVEIGLAQLKQFMRCAGSESFMLESIEYLIGLKCVAHVKIRKDDEYPDQNVISYFKETLKTETNSQGEIPF